MILNNLTKEHVLRKQNLIEIGAQYKGKKDKLWREILPSFCIARCCFNDLGRVWTKHDKFRSTKARGQSAFVF